MIKKFLFFLTAKLIKIISLVSASKEKLTKEANASRFLFLATKLAKTASLVYSPKEKILKKLSNSKLFSSWQFFDKNGTQALALVTQSKVIIAFRGTELNLQDIKTDINCNKIEVPNIGFVHQGFWEALNAVLNDILLFVKDHHQQKEILITGHSMGGALAVLLGTYLQANNIHRFQVFTFGSPRCLSWKTAKKVDALIHNKVFLFINSVDIVPRVPFLLMGFGHIGKVFFLDSKAKLYYDISYLRRLFLITKHILFRLAYQTSFLIFFGILVNQSLKAHQMKTYLKKLAKNRKKKTQSFNANRLYTKNN